MAFVATIAEFPFCQVDTRAELPVDTLSGITTDGFPVATTREDFFKWVWRVRTWELTGNIEWAWSQTYSADWNNPDPPYNTLPGPWHASGSVSAAISAVTVGQYAQGEETKLVCSADGIQGSDRDSGAAFINDDFPDLTPGYASTFTWNVSFGTGTGPRWKTNSDGSVWYPKLIFSGTVSVGAVSARWSSVYEEETAGNVYDYGAITFAGESVPIQLVYDDYFGEVSGTFSVGLTIAPYEWYEYDPDDGDGPVYDSGTGARTARTMPNP